MAVVQVYIARRVLVFHEFDRYFVATLGCKVADLVTPETTRVAVRSVDGRLGALRSTQIGGLSGSVEDAVSTRGVSLGPYKPCVAHLFPLVSCAAVGARIVLRLILVRNPAVVPRTTTSPALMLLLLLPSCPALATLLLLLLTLLRLRLLLILLLLLLLLLQQLPGCPGLAMLLLLLLVLLPRCPFLAWLLLLMLMPNSPVHNTTSRFISATHVVSGVGNDP